MPRLILSATRKHRPAKTQRLVGNCARRCPDSSRVARLAFSSELLKGRDVADVASQFPRAWRKSSTRLCRVALVRAGVFLLAPALDTKGDTDVVAVAASQCVSCFQAQTPKSETVKTTTQETQSCIVILFSSWPAQDPRDCVSILVGQSRAFVRPELVSCFLEQRYTLLGQPHKNGRLSQKTNLGFLLGQSCQHCCLTVPHFVGVSLTKCKQAGTPKKAKLSHNKHGTPQDSRAGLGTPHDWFGFFCGGLRLLSRGLSLTSC